VTTFLHHQVAAYPTLRTVLAAAADNDLFRINDSCDPDTGKPCDWRRADGTPVDSDAVYAAIRLGLLGILAAPERLPDGTWASRMDLSEHVLDDYLDLTTRS
jgi:hypothetical protein